LTRIPGIGPALAGRIVAWRAAHGAFGTLDELEKVPGIGPATVARIRSSGAAIP
jgi:competence protein ComEA